MSENLYARYNGGGFLNDIPARDLTRAEFDALTKDQQAAVLACGSYDVKQPNKNAPAIDGPKES